MDFDSAEEDPHHHHRNSVSNLFSYASSSSPSSTSAAVGPTPAMSVKKEYMFDKVVTPSDVGKLNRLVIPKQHAERFFPLDSSSNEKGLLLNFEDRIGKLWRFRYSYWNSSQSYVMTKGWSRFVKEKKLEAGDIVSFQRGVGDLGKDRLYIDYRRRPEPHELSFGVPPHHHPLSFHRGNPGVPWSVMRPPPPLHLSQLHNFAGRDSYYSQGSGFNNYNNMGSMYHLRSQQQQQQQSQTGILDWPRPMVYESVPIVVQGKEAAAGKRLRLFGVNMDCPISEAGEDECDILSSNVISTSLSSSSTILHNHYHEVAPSTQQGLHHHHHQASSNSNNTPNSSSHYNHEIQLRLYHGTPMQFEPSSNKGKSSISLDLDI